MSLTRVAIDVCPDCLQGRGPLPLGQRTVCREPLCFFSEEVRPSYEAMPSRIQPPMTYELLMELLDFLDDRADVRDGSYGEPAPNKAMQLQREVQELLDMTERLKLASYLEKSKA